MSYFETPLFAIVGLRPAKSVRHPVTGGLCIFVYDWETGDFLLDLKYLDKLYLGNDFDTVFITEQEFEDYVLILEEDRLRKTQKAEHYLVIFKDKREDLLRKEFDDYVAILKEDLLRKANDFQDDSSQ